MVALKVGDVVSLSTFNLTFLFNINFLVRLSLIMERHIIIIYTAYSHKRPLDRLFLRG